MAQRRVGAGESQRIAAQRSLEDGLALLKHTTYGERLAGCTDRAAAERGIRSTVLWQLRVLAGWIPGTGTRLARAAAGGYERDNIVALARSLEDTQPPPEFFDLGALATSWPRLRDAQSAAELGEALHTSPWGDAGSGDTTARRDILTVVWLGRLAAVAEAARPWAEAASGLMAARMLLVDRSVPSARFREVAHPLLGRAWEGAGSLDELRSALPKAASDALRDADGPKDLWLSEARLRATVETDGFRLLRGAMPGPTIVLGGIAVLAMDAWRVRAALSAADSGTGTSEVLDAVA
ncbi:V-type ATPase subunit [Cryobacterium psychrophilum]|uniref:V-type ATPase subunit n=1 Tax=Cryobacterium psychrophilum TaxID=41988 RepID=A0A4Y8KPR5_9MICO|nr:V-type ATPase subunit [Cryobacterium psychrophilum]TFD80598.1 hypothetical protein E3T53_04615 [Cryobacterium psychrophilum]